MLARGSLSLNLMRLALALSHFLSLRQMQMFIRSEH